MEHVKYHYAYLKVMATSTPWIIKFSGSRRKVIVSAVPATLSSRILVNKLTSAPVLSAYGPYSGFVKNGTPASSVRFQATLGVDHPHDSLLLFLVAYIRL